MMNEGDWMCPDAACGNINFSRRSSCNRCAKERTDLKFPSSCSSKKKLGTEIGKSAADKSRGLFSADDWQCSKCANVNWARRQTCNVCNAPKFGEQVEARTGYGGGYNERGTVEYRTRHDSDDDEYDEFGRRKKRGHQDKIGGSRGRREDRRRRSGDHCEADGDSDTDRRCPRRSATLVMNNMVSSTNDVTYRFKGRTQDDSFVVIYTLEERIELAAMAVAFQNCKKAAERFEYLYDKPAPDFKAIFVWRQRLLTTGCLVDSHSCVGNNSGRSVDPDPEPQPKRRKVVNGKYLWRKKQRYYKVSDGQKNNSSSSSESSDHGAIDNDSGRIALKTRKRKRSFVRSLRSESIPDDAANNVVVLDDADDATTQNKDGSVASDACADKMVDKDLSQSSDNVKQVEERRSETPEITSARVETNVDCFYEDNYFDDVDNVEKVDSVFRMPDVPKTTACVKKAVQIEAFSNLLEDIVSESERYSSDGGDAELDAYESDAKDKDDAEEVAENKVCEKTMTPALRRIFQSMQSSNVIKDCEQLRSDNVMEYVPTKIDPDMAKRNHQLFRNDDAWNESKNSTPVCKSPVKDVTYEEYCPEEDDLYREASPIADTLVYREASPVADTLVCREATPVADKLVYREVTPVADKLVYKEVAPISDKLVVCREATPVVDKLVVFREASPVVDKLKTPPEAPKIGSIEAVKAAPCDFMNFNFSCINAEDLAKALLNIKNMANDRDVESNSVVNVSEEIVVGKEVEIITEDVAKNGNIPFLDDMFDPGSPPSKKAKESNVITDIDSFGVNANQDLEDVLECPLVKANQGLLGGGFKSFAIPKPIMLNRLRSMAQKKAAETNMPDSCGEGKEKRERKKKIKKTSSKDSNSSGVKRSEVEEQEEVDEEEDSGEEGDLSKYDLWGSGDEENTDKPSDKADQNKSSPNLTNDKATPETPAQAGAPPPVKSPAQNNSKRRRSDDSDSGSSRRSSSSSSSSSTSSAPRPPRNRYDDFNLNSEHSRANSPEESSRSPLLPRNMSATSAATNNKDARRRDAHRSRSRSPQRKDRRRDERPRDRRRDERRDRDRPQRARGLSGRGPGGYARGRAR